MKLYNKNIIISLYLFALSLLMPLIINVKTLGLYESLYSSIDLADQGLLIITSFKLVLMNSVRILPIYMLCFTVIEWMNDLYNRKVPKFISLFALISIPIMYKIIELLLNVHYDFGYTSIIVIIAIFLIVNLDLSRVSIIKKSIVLIMLLMGLQWVDIIPKLSGYGFGRGEVSYDVKMAASFMKADEAVTFSAIIFFIFFIVNALMILKFLKDQDTVVKSLEKQNQMQVQMRELELQTLRARSYEEMQYLVHDLKSPLTSIQALVSFSEMIIEDEKVVGYMQKISGSVDQLNKMISEILYEKKRNMTSFEELFETILSQLSPTATSQKITYTNNCENGYIEINKIRFSRMIINILNNSMSALDKDESYILIDISSNKKYVELVISDNGKGISKEDLYKIRERGFSTKGSSGLGLRYVEDVVSNHGGELFIQSELGVGTVVTIRFEKELINYEENIDC